MDLDSPFVRSLAAGAVAGCTVDAILFPLDSLKTRLQAKHGQRNFKKIYNGLPVVLLGNSVGSAAFFATYEESKAWFHAPRGRWEAVLADSASAVLGELIACTFRTPAEILKQRMQALQVTGIVQGMQTVHVGGLLIGFRAMASRDLVFSAIQYPAYEYVKACVSKDRRLSAWESALCGSLTGSVTAVITTPLDVVKTRIMLDKNMPEQANGIGAEVSRIYRAEGLRAFFHGAYYRSLWMGLGGLIFLGSYEKAKELLDDKSPPIMNFSGRYAWSLNNTEHMDPADKKDEVRGFAYRRCWYAETPSSPFISPSGPEHREQLEGKTKNAAAAIAAAGKPAERLPVASRSSSQSTPARSQEAQKSSSPFVSIGTEMLAGGIAGCAVDVSLYPIDTMKTRMQAAAGFWRAGGVQGIWRGVSAPALAGIPASAVFWAVYVPMKKQLYSITGSHTRAEVLSGPVSEIFSLLVRVPSEVIKQRLQAGIYTGPLKEVVRHIHATEGLSGFYAGFAATCFRSVPFALIQFPVYEELKRQMDARMGKGSAWWTGGASGALAGGAAAVLTTPLDVVKTRIMLAPREERLSFSQMAWHVSTKEGPRGLFAGVVPRGVFLSLGGMVYLGVYNGVADHLRKFV